jgi:hypothetical protein
MAELIKTFFFAKNKSIGALLAETQNGNINYVPSQMLALAACAVSCSHLNLRFELIRTKLLNGIHEFTEGRRKIVHFTRVPKQRKDGEPANEASFTYLETYEEVLNTIERLKQYPDGFRHFRNTTRDWIISSR